MARNRLEQLFERYVTDRDESAIAELVDRTRPRLLGAAKRICGASDADDCVQTAYMSLLHKRESGMDAPVLPWLMTAVVRIAYRHKAQSRKQKDLARRLSLAPRETSAFDDDEIARLRDRIDQLPAAYRDPVVLHYLEGLGTDDAARLLDISRDALKKRLQRARACLRSSWNPRLTWLLFAVPWFLADAASAATIGGLVMTKKSAIIATIAALALGTGVVLVKRSQRLPTEHTARREAPPRVEVAATTPEPETNTPPPETPTGYYGVVVDSSGAPVQGALVELRKLYWHDQGREHVFHRDPLPEARNATKTERDGGFRLEAQWKDPCVVAAELHVVAEGHPRTLARAPRGAATRVTLKAGGRLSVTVRDEEAAPVDAVAVMLCEGKRQPVTYPRSPPAFVVRNKTDAAGAVAFHISPGRYRVLIDAPGFVPVESDVLELAAGGSKDLELTLESGTSLAVHVVDEEGRDVPAAKVEARGPHHSGGIATADDEGRCRIGGLAPPPLDGDYWRRQVFWHVEAEGFAASHGSRTLPKTAGVEKAEVVLRRGVPVVVRVIDPAGRPLAGASVMGSYDRNMANTIQRRFNVRTDANGRAEMPRMMPGKRTWSVYLHDYVRGTLDLEIGAEPVESEVTLTKLGSSIKGVLQQPDGTVATGGTIGFVRDDSKQWRLGMICVWPISSDGTFEIKDAPMGVGRIHARASGFGAQSWPFTAKPGVTADLRLTELESIKGKIVDRGGRPLGGVKLTLYQQRERDGVINTHDVGFSQSQPDGQFTMRGVGASKYRLRARSQEWIPVNAFGLEVKGGARDLVIRMKPASEGSGIKLVVNLDPPHVAGVQGYFLLKGIKQFFRPKREKKDRLEIRIYHEPGVYDFTFTAPGYLPFTAKAVRIEDRPDNPSIDVRFDRGAALRVRVLDGSGEPLRNTGVRHGNEMLRTDENGECELGGFEPGVVKIHLSLGSDYMTYVRDHEARVPGRTEVTLRRHAHVYVKHTLTYGELKKGASWQLLDGEGRVVAEKVFDMAKIGRGYAKDRQVAGWVATTQEGQFRVVAEIDGERSERAITVTLGKLTKVALP